MLDLRSLVVGASEDVPTLDRGLLPYVSLDNAASTPAMRPVVDTVERLLPYYSGVHRGTGYKSRVSTDAYEQARSIVAQFVGADPDRDVVLFTKNTTEAINRLARSMPAVEDSVVLTTLLEHHSNDLPWRARGRTIHIGARPDGTLDEEDLDRRLAQFAGRIELLAVTGASNVTGVVQPIHELAAKVHAVGGRLLVDAAQLAPHRPIDMRSHDDPGHIDFVAFSAHKMYAPFGSGVLVGQRDAFGAGPDHAGGGTVDAVTVDDVAWTDLPDREEAGSPNVVGAVALAAAATILDGIGMERIAAHEALLTRHALARLADVPGVTVHGPRGADASTSKVGVIPFNVDNMDHGLVAAILSYEHAVGLRNGCFCAHPYVTHLLGVGAAETREWFERVRAGDKREAPGLVRISFGCYNDIADVDRVVDALEQIVAGDIAGVYRCDDDGSYRPRGYVEPGQQIFDASFHLDAEGVLPWPHQRPLAQHC